MSASENVLFKKMNKEKYSISLIAKFEEPHPVSYIIRVTAPNGHKTDYACTLECCRNISELLTALCYFAETELYLKDTKKLKTVLTAENLWNFADVLNNQLDEKRKNF